MAKNMKNKVLDVNDLHVSFDTYAGEVQAVRGVTFQLHEGEVLAIVGESGCGKSVTAQTIMKLNPMPPARIPQGEVHLGEHDIVKASEKEMQQLRGKEVSMIFQDPMTCLNPTKQVGKQIVEAIRHHQHLSAKEAKEQAIKYLKLVNIPNAEERAKQYPHEFSGGMRQRAMIAMALSCNPKVLIADEPTTALDVTIQAQIMDTSLPRSCCISFSLAATMSCSHKRTSPWGMRAGGMGFSFITVWAVTLLPQPDSPTMASTSPWCRLKVTPRTAFTSPA